MWIRHSMMLSPLGHNTLRIHKHNQHTHNTVCSTQHAQKQVSRRRGFSTKAQYRYSWCGAAINARWWIPLLFVRETALTPQDDCNPLQYRPRVLPRFALKACLSPSPKKQTNNARLLSSLLGADFTFTSIMHECQWMQWINAKQNNKSCIPWVLPALSNAGERIECHSLLGKTSYYGEKAGPMVCTEET